MLDHTVNVPSLNDLHGDSHVCTRHTHESAQTVQDEAEARFAALASEDHCYDCGQIAGQLCIICDACLARWTVTQLGSALMRSTLAHVCPVGRIRFRDHEGHPIAIAPGDNIQADNVTVFDLREAVSHFGWTQGRSSSYMKSPGPMRRCERPSNGRIARRRTPDYHRRPSVVSLCPDGPFIRVATDTPPLRLNTFRRPIVVCETELSLIVCWECFVTFAIPKDMHVCCRQTEKHLFCPNGHELHFSSALDVKYAEASPASPQQGAELLKLKRKIAKLLHEREQSEGQQGDHS